MQPKQLSNGKTVQFFLSDIAKGLFNGVVANYLTFIYQPEEGSGLPNLLPTNKFLGFLTVLALLTFLTKLVDAISDPIVANISDKCKSKYGRRMPFMRIAAIPYALSVFVIYMAPFENGSVGNAVWVGIALVIYYVFYTLYQIPKTALVPELITDHKKRVPWYALSTVFFMGSSAVMYATTLFVSWFKAAGLSPLWSYRAVFAIFTVVGCACLLLSAFAFREKDYVRHTHRPTQSFIKAMGIVFKNKQFLVFTFGDLCNYIAMAFFQTAMLYYITVLINVPEDQAFYIMGAAIITAIILFPFIMKVCRKYNKKTPLLVGSWMFAALFTAIFFGDKVAELFYPYQLVLGILMGICVAYPFAVINIIPQAIVSDIIQAESLKTGVNREGMYSAVKTFMEKVAYAVAGGTVSILLAVGSTDSSVTLEGVKYTGLCAGIFALLSAIIISFYRDKQVTDTILNTQKRVKAQQLNSNGVQLTVAYTDGSQEIFAPAASGGSSAADIETAIAAAEASESDLIPVEDGAESPAAAE